ncbi:tetratricopeptide repeat protein [Streptomyces sp. NPDC049687]|uniref:AfsR/SARP family transcriptional regulator n=1 Tax=Streptomyces sp. NPDC049687 TaxID=3365596 RepID=UPI0037A5525D
MTGFRLLGPVELWVSGRPVALGPAKRRTVLAALLVDAGRWVAAETLIDRVWGEDPPAQVRSTLYAHIARIRRILADTAPHLSAGADGSPPAGADVPLPGGADAHGSSSPRSGSTTPQLLRGSGGYRLDMPQDLVDAHRFRRLVTRARAADESDAGRVALLREALGLWRSEPLAGLSGEWAARTRECWRQQHIEAVLAWADAELRVGGHLGVVDTLSALVAEHPLTEPLAVALMRALHAAGRAPEALACYTALRRRLADELGTAPGAEAQREHQAILSGKPAASAVRRTPPGADAAHARPVPTQLPMDAGGFTGREEELAQLEAMLATAAERPAAVVVSAVSGTAGVGKTALAVHWAHRARPRFPDGQLYVNLRGYDPDQPVTAADALVRFLTALGVSGQDVPLELDDRAARYRSEAADRRMLIVLDNAATVEQVRPLLPGTGTCAVLVTSRDSLAGLVAREGAHRLDLDLLPAVAARTLLCRLIGPRADADPDAVDALAAQCARLPLALRVAAELAAARPTTPLADLVVELADQQRRLDLLDADGDPRAAVAAVFSWSLRHLPPDAARTFRLLGLHPGTDLDAYAAAALSDSSPADTRRALDVLARAHLVQPVDAARYGMHDLLRAYAARLATAEDAPQTRRAALDRLFDYYLATAAAAMNCLHPAEAHLRPEVRAPSTPAPELSDPDAARAWLNTELPCLTAVAAHTATHDRPTHTIRLSAILYRYLIGGHHTDGLTIHGHARDAARQAADPASEARALLGLGTAYWQLARHEPAGRHLQQALTLFRRVGDATGQARALINLGLVAERLGRYRPACEFFEQALVLYRGADDQAGEALALKDLATVERRLGRYGQAAEHLRQALTLFRRTGNRYLEAHALNDLGTVEARLDQYGSAAHHQEQALALSREVGDRYGEAGALHSLGTIHTRLGQPEKAAERHQEAFIIYSGNGDRDGEARALNGLGEAARAAGRHADALTHHTDALAIAEDIGNPGQQARAHGGLGDAHHALGDAHPAVRRYERALALYTELGMPEADDIRALLATVTGPRPRR